MTINTGVTERSEYKTSDSEINEGEFIVNVHVNGHVAQEYVGRIRKSGTGHGCFQAWVRMNPQVGNRAVASMEEHVGYFDDLESATCEIEARHRENNPGWPGLGRTRNTANAAQYRSQ